MNRTAFVRAVLLALSLLAWLLAAANRQERRPLDRPMLADANRKPFSLFYGAASWPTERQARTSYAGNGGEEFARKDRER